MYDSSPVTLRRIKQDKCIITLNIEALEYDKAKAEIEKMNYDGEMKNMPKCWINFLNEMIKFKLRIDSQCTIDQLAKALVEVSRKLLIIEFNSSLRDSSHVFNTTERLIVILPIYQSEV